MKSLVLVALFIASALAQSYMLTPQGRGGNTPSTIAPCGAGDVYTTTHSVSAGRYILVTWLESEDGEDGGTVNLNLLNTTEGFVLSLANVTFENNQYNLRIPPATEPGTHILQWTWRHNGVRYYTCAQLNVTPDLINAQTLTFGQTATRTLEGNFTYFEFTRNPNSLLSPVITASLTSGSGPLTIAARHSLLVLPTETVYDEIDEAGPGEQIVMGLCPRDTYWYIGATGPENTPGTDTYTLRVTEENVLVNIGTAALSVSAHSGNRYFVTQSYATPEGQRRVVLKADGNHNNPTFELDDTCNFNEVNNNDYIEGTYVSDSVACIQLGDEAGNKYIRVGPMGTSYTMQTENGLCADAGAANLKIPVAFVLLCIFALIKFF